MDNEVIEQMYTALWIFLPVTRAKWPFYAQHNFQVWEINIWDEWKTKKTNPNTLNKNIMAFYLEIYLEIWLELP